MDAEKGIVVCNRRRAPPELRHYSVTSCGRPSGGGEPPGLPIGDSEHPGDRRTRARHVDAPGRSKRRNMVTRIMRIAPGAELGEHHHPFFDESFIVHSGEITVSLNGEPRELRRGDVAFIPAGTVIRGLNAGTEEAVVVVVWATVGIPGPLSVPGRP